MVEYPDIALNAALVVSLYLGWKIISSIVKFIYKDEPHQADIGYKYVDDEPDGTTYVTMPNGDRRLD